MEVIKLINHQWEYDPSKRLGAPGGFGDVYVGNNKDNPKVAVKRLRITADEAAHRELEIADLLLNLDLNYVMPVLDYGQDAESNSYFVVMPVAEYSLSDFIRKKGQLQESKTLKILKHILFGLKEIKNIVHRDLKPQNILYFNNNWRVADFGIARFVEASTSLRTLKDCLTPPYASPEQWKLERATLATDIYALGCIGYEMLFGRPPFEGPTSEDYREQHLNHQPDFMYDCWVEVRALLRMMLRKTPESRPSQDRVEVVIKNILGKKIPKKSAHNKKLAEAFEHVMRVDADKELSELLQESKREKRKWLAQEADTIFKSIRSELFENIIINAPSASVEENTRIRIGGAVLEMILDGGSNGISKGKFHQSEWDVVLGGHIAVRQSDPVYIWGSSLWYAKLKPQDDYRWREVGYMHNPLLGPSKMPQPFFVADLEQADIAAGPGVGPIQIAFGPKCVDDEDTIEFIEKWMELIAKAIRGKLEHPRHLP
jgi:serine/threonine protein kinase